jgi:hypothetical protein
MTDRAELDSLLDQLPEDRVRQVIDFARYLAGDEERKEWQALGLAQLAKAYGDDEPEYTEADLKPVTEREPR